MGEHVSSELTLAQVFVELADTLVDEFDTIDFLSTLAERSVGLLNADAAGVIIDDGGELRLVASTSDRSELVELFELQNDEGPCLDCLRSGQPVVNVTGPQARERWPLFTAAAEEVGYQGVYAIPLRLRDSVVGAMNLFSLDPVVLDPEGVTLAQALADIATIGLLQERAVRESRMLADQLQTALDSRIVIEQAKGVLLAGAAGDVDEAFRAIRAYSRRNNLALKDVATAVIDRHLDMGDLVRLPAEPT